MSKKKPKKSNSSEKSKIPKNMPTLQLKKETDIAMDFALKAYKKFDKMVKSIILFGSTAKQTAVTGSDIDIIILIDDASINWDQELIAWYREELEKLIKSNPYQNALHINTVKLSTWWEDLMRGDPIVVNILRYGEPMIDMAGFFNPLKALLIKGKIKSTPEAIYSALQRAPQHIARSKISELGAIEGVYWAMIDSAQAALITAGKIPPSPEHIPGMLKQTFVDSGMLKIDAVKAVKGIYTLHKSIAHKEISDIKGVEIDKWQETAEKFLSEMVRIIDSLLEKK